MSKYSWFVLFHIQSDAHPSPRVLTIPQSLFLGCPLVVTFHSCCSVELFYTSFLQGFWLYLPSHENSPIPSCPLFPLTQPRGVRSCSWNVKWESRSHCSRHEDGEAQDTRLLARSCSWLTHVCSFQHLAQVLGPVSCLLLSLVYLSTFLHTSTLPLLSIVDFRSLYALLPPCRPSLQPSSFPCEKDCVISHISWSKGDFIPKWNSGASF